jgi:tetratricopeptide (TPR) repeat protein
VIAPAMTAVRLLHPASRDSYFHSLFHPVDFMSDLVAKYNQAEQFKDAGKTDEAVDVLNEIISEDPDHVLSHLTLARIYTQTGRHLEAVEHGRRACELEPNDSFNYTALSMTYQKAWAGTGDRNFIMLAEEAMAHARNLEH